MNSQDILRNLGISLDVELDNSETYDYEIAGFDGDYDPKVIDFTNPISYDIAIQNNLTNDSILKICVDLCEIDNTPNDPNYIYSGITETIRFEDFTEHFNIEDSEGNILHAYKNFILNNDVFTYTGYTGETHYFKVCGYRDCITPSPTPTSTELPTSTPNPTATPEPTPNPTATELPTSTPNPTSTPEPTPNPTATCTTTVQYLNVQLTDSAKFKLSLWIDDQFTQPDSAECDYVVSGQARGDMGTVYEGVETMAHGDHNHQFNLASVLNDGEVVTGFTVYSIDTTQCTCPTIVDFDPFKPTPTPEPTQTLTPTPTSTQIPRLSGVVSSFNPNSNNPITLNELIQPFVEQSYGTIYSFICNNDVNQIVYDLTKGTTGDRFQIPNIGDVITNINDNTPYSNDNLLHFKQTTFGTFNTMTDYRWITTDENGTITDITQLPLCPTPNPTATENPTATPVPTSTEQPTPMPTVTEQPTPTPNPTSTPEPTPEPTSTPQPTPIPTVTENPTATPNPTATEQPTPIPTATEPPTATPIPTSTETPTPTPTDTPLPTTGLLMDFDASTSNSFTQDPYPSISDGDTIVNWNNTVIGQPDFGGVGTIFNPPTWDSSSSDFNNLGAVNFVPNQSLIAHGITGLSSSNAYTMFIVVTTTSTSSQWILQGLKSNNTADDSLTILFTNGNFQVTTTTNYNRIIPYTTNTPTLYTVVYDGTQSGADMMVIRENGVFKNSGTVSLPSNLNSTLSGIELGTNAGESVGLYGQIPAFKMYNTVLTNSEITTVENSLMNKFNL